MRRVLVIVVVFLAGLGLAAGLAVRRWGDAADKEGFFRYRHRSFVARQLVPESPGERARGRRSVVWMGDSTLLGLQRPSYPQLLAPSLAAQGIRSTVVGWLGLDFYGYYFLTTTVMQVLHPDVLVVVAHLRLFAPPLPPSIDRPLEARARFDDLASFLLPSEIPGTLVLPMAERGHTMPRLLLAQSLRLASIEQLLRWYEGGRGFANDAMLAVMGPARESHGLRDGLAAIRTALGESDVDVTPAKPIVRMMAATVRYATEHGACVVVIGTPLPFEAMERKVGYDPARYARRFEVLRDVVIGSGGTFVDLHDALPANEFVDPVGHFNEAGARRMAQLVDEAVRDAALRGCRRAR